MIYIIQHNDETPAGSSLDWCKKNHREFQIIHLVNGDTLPKKLTQQDQVIICGGGMNVNEEHLYPWLKEEKQFIKMCLDNSIKILGLCLGGQLLAEALGARASQHPHWEVGWSTVELSPTLQFFDSKLEAFQWHGFSFDTPKDGLRLASNAICTHQGFIYKNFALGLQFHPEATLNWIKECADTDNYPSGPFVQTREEIYTQLEKQLRLQTWYFALLDWFFKFNS